MWIISAVTLLANVWPVDGACDYASLTTDLNTCMTTASGGASTKWGYPYGTIAEQATFCTTANQATLKTCIEAIFTACNANAKSLKMFSSDGANLVNAYVSLCSNTLVTDAHACMSSTTVATYTAAETTFITAVDNLNTATTSTEICGYVVSPGAHHDTMAFIGWFTSVAPVAYFTNIAKLATTLKFTGYTELLTVTCTTAAHLAVWSSFYDNVLDTYVCPTCASSRAAVWRPNTALLVGIVWLLVLCTFRKGE